MGENSRRQSSATVENEGDEKTNSEGNNSANEQRRGSEEDEGGGGDTHSIDGSQAKQFSLDETVSQDRRKKVTSLGGSQQMDSNEVMQSDQTDNYSKKSGEMSLVQQIVMLILEDLLDAVMTEIETKPEFIDKDEVFDGGLENPEEATEIKDKERNRVSSVTEPSIEQQITVSETELQAQLALEQELEALRKEQYEKNIALYYALSDTSIHLKQRNAFLLKQIYELYKSQKIEHLFHEMPERDAESEGKYIKLLFEYEQAQSKTEKEGDRMERQINILEEKRANTYLNLEEEFNSLLEKERQVGRNLISSQAAKSISEKMIDKLISRQVSKSEEVSKQRHTYFKLRDAVAADENLLKSLQTLGENLTLMEYEQLKMQSQSCVEKLEERDADLHRLRSKATSAIQVLAEIREKAQALYEEIEASKVILHEVDHQLCETRERLGSEKKRRDLIRSDAVRLRQEAGLLSEPKLLKDYKTSNAEKDQLSQHLTELKHKFEQQKQTIAGLRKIFAGLNTD